MSLCTDSRIHGPGRRVHAAALVLVLVFACGPVGEAPPPLPQAAVQQATSSEQVPASSAAPAPELPPRDYLLESATGTELFSKDPPALFLGDGKVGFSAGCNSHSGRYRADGDMLFVSGFSATRRGCPDEGYARDGWLSSFFESRPRFRLVGPRLTLQGSGGTLVFLDRTIADPDRPLAGTNWTVSLYLDKPKDASIGLRLTESPLLEFRPDGTWTVRTPCGSGRGRYAARPPMLVLTDNHFVGPGCEGEPERGSGNNAHIAHDYVRKVMSSTSVRYSIQAGNLELEGDQYGLSLRDHDRKPAPGKAPQEISTVIPE